MRRIKSVGQIRVGDWVFIRKCQDGEVSGEWLFIISDCLKESLVGKCIYLPDSSVISQELRLPIALVLQTPYLQEFILTPKEIAKYKEELFLELL